MPVAVKEAFLCGVLLVVLLASVAVSAADDQPYQETELDLSDDLYDAGFYDRKAPNEHPDTYSKDVRREEIKRSTYGDQQYKRDLSRHGMGTHVVKRDPKEEEIMILEQELDSLRQSELIAQANRLNTAVVSRDTVKRSMPWFPSASESARLQRLDDEVNRQRMSLEVVKQKEQALVNRLKPLYGIVSWHFVADQQLAIRNSMSTMTEMGYNNAWYTALFSIGQAESLGEVLATFATQFVVALLIMYPIALLYFALWTAPWNVYYYSSSIVDIIPGIGMYVASVILMALPFLVLVGGFYLFFKMYGGAIAERARANAERQDAMRRAYVEHRGTFTGGAAAGGQQGAVPFQADDVRRRNVPPQPGVF